MFLLTMASFVLPVLISPSETGDLRGGATSEAGQMAYVLGQPLAYAAVLFKNIFSSFPSYVLGEGALERWAIWVWFPSHGCCTRPARRLSSQIPGVPVEKP